MNIEISDMAINKNCVNASNNTGCGPNIIVEAPGVALIKPDTGGLPAIDGTNNIGTIDYRAIARAALSTTSDGVSELDLYLALFDSKPMAFTCISPLHQNGPTDVLHFGFVLVLSPQKQVRFRVNGWLSNGFKIVNLQKRTNGVYTTVATMT